MTNQIPDPELPDRQLKLLRARFGKARPLDVRFSDNPLAAIWRDLQRYSGLHKARQIFPPEVADDDLRSFCAYIELAESYASLAEEADMILDPLLLYYAAMWLSRAVIALKLGIDVAKHQKAHGGKPKPHAEVELKMLGGTLEVHRRGTIPTLIEALGGNVTPAQTFRLISLLRGLPELDSILAETLGERTTAIPVDVEHDAFTTKFNNVQVTLLKPMATQELACLPVSDALRERGASVFQDQLTKLIWNTQANLNAELATLFISTPSGYFVENRIDGSYIPEFAIYVCILHALSEFTRYYPREWLDLYDEHGPDYALVREFMHLAERKVPELALSEMANRRTGFQYP